MPPRALPVLGEQPVAIGYDLVERHLALGPHAVAPVRIGARPRRAGGPHADPGAQPDPLQLARGGLREDHVVGAGAVASHHRIHAGRAELQPLQRAELGFDFPPFLVGRIGQDGVEHPAPRRPVEALSDGFQQAAAQVAVQVDHARQYRLARAVDERRRGMRLPQRRRGTHLYDAVAPDRDRGALEDAAPGVHRDYESVVQQQIGHDDLRRMTGNLPHVKRCSMIAVRIRGVALRRFMRLLRQRQRLEER